MHFGVTMFQADYALSVVELAGGFHHREGDVVPHVAAKVGVPTQRHDERPVR